MLILLRLQTQRFRSLHTAILGLDIVKAGLAEPLLAMNINRRTPISWTIIVPLIPDLGRQYSRV